VLENSDIGMSLLDQVHKHKASNNLHYEWTSTSSASVAAAASVTDDAVSTTTAAAALEANDPANAVVLPASSWPVATVRPDTSSVSSYFEAVELVTLQSTPIYS